MLEDEVIASPIHNDNAIYIYDAVSIEGDSIEEFISGYENVENQLEDVVENTPEELIVAEEILLAEEIVLTEEVVPEMVKKRYCCKDCFDISCFCFCIVVIILIIYFFSGVIYL
jgi:hypothetical protein